MKFAFPGTSLIVIASGLICGCGGTTDEERLKSLVPNAAKTTPVHGTLLVDGEPVKGVWVKLHADDPSAGSVLPKAQTESDGTFRITTYIGGDGAPPGHYKVTAEWLTFQQAGARWVGPNRIADKYGSPKTSPFEVTVGSEPVSMPAFEVEAKSEEELKTAPVPRPQKKRKGRRQGGRAQVSNRETWNARRDHPRHVAAL